MATYGCRMRWSCFTQQVIFIQFERGCPMLYHEGCYRITVIYTSSAPAEWQPQKRAFPDR